jgi:hypothetical protein
MSVGSIAPTIGSIPAIATECIAKFALTNLTLIGNCKTPIDTFLSFAKLKEIDYWDNVELCSTQCRNATRIIEQDLKSAECRDQMFDSTTSGKELGTYVAIGTTAGCIRTADDQGYCLHSQSPALVPVLERARSTTDAVLQILMNSTIACTDCFEKELQAAQATDLSDLDVDVRLAINALRLGYRLRCPRLAIVPSLPIPPRPTTSLSTVPTSTSLGPTPSTSNHARSMDFFYPLFLLLL